MLRRRKNKKATKQQISNLAGKLGKHFLFCKVCNLVELEVSMDVSAVTCAWCVIKIVSPPELYSKPQKSDKPRGWHFKTYFEHEGKVYSKGIEITDAKEIKKLKKSMTSSSTSLRGKQNVDSSK
jgi:hypothetical protein